MERQEKLLEACRKFSAVEFPSNNLWQSTLHFSLTFNTTGDIVIVNFGERISEFVQSHSQGVLLADSPNTEIHAAVGHDCANRACPVFEQGQFAPFVSP